MKLRNHIVLNLWGGGVGNQLFQYAAGLRLALKSGIPLLINKSAYESSGGGEDRWKREYVLDQFQISGRCCTTDELSYFSNRSGLGRMRRSIDFVVSGGQRGLIIEEQRRHRVPHPIFDDSAIRRRVMLSGRFEYEANAEAIEMRLREELQFRNPPNDRNLEVIERMRSCESVAIHIRGGDLIEDPVIGARRVRAGVEYFQRAFARVQESVQQPDCFVFSDSMEIARETLTSLPARSIHFVDHNGPEKPIEDLRLMMSCRHHILTASTFGWWGAWLGKRPGQIVIAPKEYFSNGQPPTEHYYPKEWITL